MPNTPQAIAVLDFGTGGGKCALFDETGHCLAIVREAWTFEPVHHEYSALADGWGFDPDNFWKVFVRCTRRAREAAGLPPRAIRAITTSAQRLGTVLLDPRGREVLCAPNLDCGGLAGGFEILDRLGPDRGGTITGHWPPWVWSLSRLLTFRRKHPETPVAHVLTPLDWMVFRLCGEIAGEPSNQAATGLLDIRNRSWSEEILSLFEIRKDLLPALLPAGSRIGGLSPAVAAELGLEPGTPVHIGGADSQCALLGSGVLSPGSHGAVLGTTAPLMRVDAAAAPHGADSPLWTGLHVVPGAWVRESNAGDCGFLWEWMLDLTGFERPAGFETAEQLLGAATLAPSSFVGFAGPRAFGPASTNPDRPLGFAYRRASTGIRPGRSALLQSFQDNLAFALRINLEQLATDGTQPMASTLTLSGGLVRSESLLRTLAAALPLTLLVGEEPNATPLGAAVLTATAAGLHGSLDAAVKAMVRTRPLGTPAADLKQAYDAAYSLWSQFDASVNPLSLRAP